jgi:hypothetical protein
MIRHFNFEDEVHQQLACVPMAVRRKLDRVGLKISLEQWQALGHGERLAVCHLPTAAAEECDAMRIFLDEAIRARGPGAAKPLSDEVRRAAEPPNAPPAQLIENARAAGVAVGQAQWDRLDADERYALIKLGGGAQCSHNFTAALQELLR